jgi:hypothetical protein
MKQLVLSLLLTGMVFSGVAQTRAQNRVWIYARRVVRPDSALTVQAFRLGQQFKPANWTLLAAQLTAQPRPAASYLGFGLNKPLIPSLRLSASVHKRHATPAQQAYWRTYVAQLNHPSPNRVSLLNSIYGYGFGLRLKDEFVSPYATNRLDRNLWGLGLERRQTDYERLSAILLERATKVRKLDKALPVLLFVVDTTGQVRDVMTDRSRTNYGLTARSRKLILKALQDERFHALEARNLFNKPHPWQERLHHLEIGRRIGRAGRFLVGKLPEGVHHPLGRYAAAFRKKRRMLRD